MFRHSPTDGRTDHVVLRESICFCATCSPPSRSGRRGTVLPHLFGGPTTAAEVFRWGAGVRAGQLPRLWALSAWHRLHAMSVLRGHGSVCSKHFPVLVCDEASHCVACIGVHAPAARLFFRCPHGAPLQLHGRWVTPVLSPEDRPSVMVRPLRLNRGNVPLASLGALSLDDLTSSDGGESEGEEGP